MKSITNRWLVNVLSVIVVVLILLNVGFGLILSSYYYQGARQALDSKANLVLNLVSRLSEDASVDLNAEVRGIVESFSDREKMEMMALGYDGQPLLTSSGFSSLETIETPDYEEAIHSGNGKGYYTGKIENGEKVMAVTVLLPTIDNEINALRFMVSLRQIDGQLTTMIIIFAGLSLMILFFVILSGLYFVKSIVVPIRDVSAVSRKIASGDLSVRLNKKSDDELGELVDTINSMADELQTSNQVKNDFISSVSHELRTPLTAIKGWGETLAVTSPEDSEMIHKGMHVILSETDRLSSMVEELLDFSRMESGRLTLVKTRMDLLAELGDAVLMYQARARKEEKSFVYEEPEMLPFVFGDRSRLRQVFVNIIDNALKYTDKGNSIRVSVAECEEGVAIVVSDTGVGIPHEDLPFVTQKFYKANMNRRGSGIGLAVANEIISLHGGSLKIESQLGEGTTVTITLPAMGGERSPEIVS